MIACPNCGFEATDAFSFCPRCATALRGAPAIAEERKTVTTLFCDLVAFTAMSEAADPEDVDRLLGEYFARATKAIESHGGTVEKFIGDAVVGVFGVPVVHEDDAERAVRAAFRLLEALKGMTRPDGSPLEARCGINTGEAFVRLDVDPATGRGFLTGDAVNVAARLQAAAPPGGVVVGQATRDLSAGAVVFEPLLPVAAKGKSEPVRAWLAAHARSRTGLRTSGRSATPFFGREKELVALGEAFEEVAETGDSRCCLVVGEPGIGKSRLVLEFARSLEAGPELITWRQGRCLPYGEGVTYWAMGEIVKAHAGIFDSDDVDTVESKLEAALPAGEDGAWLRQRLRPLLGLSTSRASREESFAAWLLFLRQIASDGPTVIVIEDLHWAGEPMLAFVEHLVSQGLGAPLLLVVTTRPELMRRHVGVLTAGDGSGAGPGGESDAGAGRLRRLMLSALSPDQVAAVIAALLEAEPAEDVRERVLDCAGGNPLYAEQYVRLLLDRGLLACAADSLHLRADADLPLPETVQAVLAARLDTLPPDHKALLCDAAVIGETFWRGGVAALSGRAASAVDEVMAALAARDLVRPVARPSIEGESEFLFWHALARDAAYGQLPRKVRARKHEAAADWLAATAGERVEEFAEVIAHHLVTALDLARAAGDADQAASLVAATITALRRAGERALRLDVAAAERHFAAALGLAGADASERLRILPSWGQALQLRNRFREAEAAYREAIAGLGALGEIRATAVAMVWLANVLLGLGEPASDLMPAAVDLLANDGPSSELAEVLSHYALYLVIEDDDPQSVLQVANRAMETCRLLALPEPAMAMSCRGTARMLLGDRGGLEDIELAVAAAKAQGLGVERATIEINRTTQVFAIRGASAERAAITEAHEFVRRHGIEVHAYSCRGLLVDNHHRTGHWDDALEQAALLLPELEAIEDMWDRLHMRSLQALICTHRGELAEAAPFVAWLAEKGRESEVGWARAYALLAASAVRLQAGESEVALHLLTECFSAPRACVSIVEVVPGAVRTAIGAGGDGLAARIVQQVDSLLPASRLPLEEHVVASIQGSVGERRAEHASAAACFAAAAAGWHEFGMPYEEGHALLGRGRCLVALDRAPDAAAPLAAAREIFARLGARPALEETDEWLARSGAAGPA